MIKELIYDERESGFKSRRNFLLLRKLRPLKTVKHFHCPEIPVMSWSVHIDIAVLIEDSPPPQPSWDLLAFELVDEVEVLVKFESVVAYLVSPSKEQKFLSR